LSPIWKGGAVGNALDFSKALIAVVLTVLAVTSLERLRRLILVQTGSVILISAVSIIKGHGQSRLQSILNGIYGNPNDLAFAIAIILPFCFALMLSTRSILQRMAWAGAMLIATAALLLTGSRGGFITLCVAGAFCLWRFAVKGKRPLIVLASVTVAVLLFVFAGNSLRQRFNAMSGENISNEMQGNAYGSYEQRWFVIKESLAQIKHHPVFGLGVGNFQVVSGSWHDVHLAYLQIASEGGIPALILFLMFFWRGFANLRRVARTPGVDADTRLVSTAVQGSLIGYAIGALFAPEAYQYFPLFAVAYTSVLLSLAKAQPEAAGSPAKAGAKGPWRRLTVYSAPAKPQPAVLAR
jgi:O-antigen ligase